MRVKISFLRDQMSANTIPLHHQTLLAESLYHLIDAFGGDRTQFNFSSLKGTSKIQNGFMRFLSSKVTLVLSSRNNQQLEQLVNKVFELPYLAVGKMNLMPRSHEIIPEPEFQTKMRYLCISPMILVDPGKDPEKSQVTIDPTSQEFSDILYEQTLDRMERAGFTEAQLNNFAEFDAQPDLDGIDIDIGSREAVRREKGSVHIDAMLCGSLERDDTIGNANITHRVEDPTKCP